MSELKRDSLFVSKQLLKTGEIRLSYPISELIEILVEIAFEEMAVDDPSNPDKLET